jgi:hypothetical protein
MRARGAPAADADRHARPGRLLWVRVRLARPRRILEIGTSNGYSTRLGSPVRAVVIRSSRRQGAHSARESRGRGGRRRRRHRRRSGAGIVGAARGTFAVVFLDAGRPELSRLSRCRAAEDARGIAARRRQRRVPRRRARRVPGPHQIGNPPRARRTSPSKKVVPSESTRAFGRLTITPKPSSASAEVGTADNGVIELGQQGWSGRRN